MPQHGTNQDAAPVAAELIAVIVAVTGNQPRVLTINRGRALPSGPFVSGHRSLQAGVRSWVEEQTHHPLGYVEQLYTFADRDRTLGETQRVVSISYLALAREAAVAGDPDVGWQGWYHYFPWEDRRQSGACTIDAAPLLAWADEAEDSATRRQRRHRVLINFGLDGERWNEELILQRYELLWEAGLVPEARPREARQQAETLHQPPATLSSRRAAGPRDGGPTDPGATPPAERAASVATATRCHDAMSGADAGSNADLPPLVAGAPMEFDHRRILATGIARLRAKIKYRPVVFELMPDSFTLLQLQRAVEALAGRLLHKQNFRRLIDQQDLVEETGQVTTETGGRPAKLFRFQRDVLAERSVAGTKLPLAR